MLVEFLVVAGLFIAVFWAGSSRTRLLSQTYPVPPDINVQTCGAYPSLLGFFCTWFRVAVSVDGLLLTQVVVPFVWRVRTFVPWSDVVVRRSGERVLLGTTKVLTIEIPLNSVVLKTMQRCLKRELPIGHVV